MGPLGTALRLAVITAVAVALLALLHAITAERIENSENLARARLLTQVAPPELFDNALALDAVVVSAPRLLGRPDSVVWRGFLSGEPSVLVVEARAPDGYNGDIDLLVGITAAGRISGVRVVAHGETPGLGDGIDHEISDWIEQFRGRALGSQWSVGRGEGEVDALTGATITSRAVTEAVERTLRWHARAAEEVYATEAPRTAPRDS